MRQMVEENERKYGAEARQRYGREAVEKASQKVLSVTRAQWQEAAKISSQLMETLKGACKTDDAAGELGLRRRICIASGSLIIGPVKQRARQPGSDVNRRQAVYQLRQGAAGLAAFAGRSAHLHRKERWAKVSGFSFAKTEKNRIRVPVFSLTLRRMDIPTGETILEIARRDRRLRARTLPHRPVAGRNGHLKPDPAFPCPFHRCR